MPPSAHLVLVSAGSLLGQNVLDAVDGRRDRVTITGLDASPDSPRLYRCDRAIISPPTDDPDFASFLQRVISTEKPTAVLPGRDPDVMLLARLRESHQSVAHLIPCGPHSVANIMNDKALSHKFACEHGLPFVPTIVPDEAEPAEVKEWVLRFGYPLLAKPRAGSGSLGIRILAHGGHLEAFLGRSERGLILQPMVQPSEQRLGYIAHLSAGLDAGIPLFAHVPDDDQYAGQALIGPDGAVLRVFTSLSRMVIGRCERSEACDAPALVSVVKAYAEAIARAGWRGMFNIQLRKHGDSYLAHEMNGRMSGSTSARRWLGFDEVRDLLRAHCGVDIGPDDRAYPDVPGVVHRSLYDDLVASQDRQALLRNGRWERPR